MTSLHRLLVLIATISVASVLPAQSNERPSRPVAPGDTVRLHENGIVLVHGILTRHDSTGLVVIDRGTRDTVHIPIFQITSAEVQRGSHRRGGSAVGQGAAVGSAVGGVLLGLTLAAPSSEDRAIGLAVGSLLAVVTTGIGTAVGTVVSFTRTATWVAFDPVAVPLQGRDAP